VFEVQPVKIVAMKLKVHSENFVYRNPDRHPVILVIIVGPQLQGLYDEK
jgi:hypothetical protein